MRSLEKINGVQKMQDYIKVHLNEDISLCDLAKACGYSPWHATRIFKELIGKTPFEYIREIRLSKAAMMLRDEKIKIIDVAFDFLFNSHEGFTRAFSKQFGMTPKYYAENTPPIKLFMPYPIRTYYLMQEKGENTMNNNKVNTVFVQVVERPERKVVLKRGAKAKDYFAYCEEVGCEVWGVLTSIKEALNEPMGMWLPENLRKNGTSTYVQGVEVPADYSGIVPEGFDIMDLKPCKMMIFQGQPYENDEDFGEAIQEVWDAIKMYTPETYGFKWADEDGPRFQLEPWGYRGYIEGKPVREVNK